MAQRRSEEAWQLVQDTYQAHRANMALTARPMQAWIERMITGYEARGQSEAIRFCIKLAGEYLQVGNVMKALETIDRAIPLWQQVNSTDPPLPALHEVPHFIPLAKSILGDPKSREAPTLASYIRTNITALPITDVVSLLDGVIPDSLRDDISGHLRGLSADACVAVDQGPEIRVHSEVVAYWSSYFAVALSRRWISTESGGDIHFSAEFVSQRSLETVVEFMYSGRFRRPVGDEEVDEVRGAADYLEIPALTAAIDDFEEAAAACDRALGK